MQFKIALLIPTLNGGSLWAETLESIRLQNVAIFKKISIDSGSTDDTVAQAKASGFEVVTINKNDFRHGATRQQLVDLAEDADICVFLTQDAILTSNDSIANIVKVFADDVTIGLAYGRQLPHKNAQVLETHARLFNYPNQSDIRSLEDKQRLGFKTIFCSNSFAAYRKQYLIETGGFPLDTIMGEDTIVAANMVNAGYKIAYVANATVYHSHSYSLTEEFRRYFDTGVFHTQHKDLKGIFGAVNGEGFRFVRSELNYVFKHNILLFPRWISSVLVKWTGYKIGSKYKLLNDALVRHFSMHKTYWNRHHNE